MTTAITATILGQVAGPISLSTTEETVNLTLGRDITAFQLIADGAWLYDSRATQSDSPSFAAGQGLPLQSQSATNFTFYARTAAGTAKLYVIFIG
jgi:hypothetical protein